MSDKTNRLTSLESKINFLLESRDNITKEVDSKLHQFAFTSAKALWSRRSRKDHFPIRNAFRILNIFVSQPQDPLLKYDLSIFLCQTMKWMADHVTPLPGRETNLSFHRKILDISQSAMKISDTYAEAYFYYAESLAWIYCNGPVFLRPKMNLLNKSIDAVIARPTRTNAPGLQIEGYGPWRLKGEIFAHDRDAQEAINFLDKSYNNARDYARNTLSYANALTDVREGLAQSIAKAKGILEELLKNNPSTLNPSRIPETEFEFFQASRILQSPPFTPSPPTRIDDPLAPGRPLP
jgi:hypothetical protein